MRLRGAASCHVCFAVASSRVLRRGLFAVRAAPAVSDGMALQAAFGQWAQSKGAAVRGRSYKDCSGNVQVPGHGHLLSVGRGDPHSLPFDGTGALVGAIRICHGSVSRLSQGTYDCPQAGSGRYADTQRPEIPGIIHGIRLYSCITQHVRPVVLEAMRSVSIL